MPGPLVVTHWHTPKNAIEAAKALGEARIFYTSHLAVSAATAFPSMLDVMAGVTKKLK